MGTVLLVADAASVASAGVCIINDSGSEAACDMDGDVGETASEGELSGGGPDPLPAEGVDMTCEIRCRTEQ
jgi:hypothetical protein